MPLALVFGLVDDTCTLAISPLDEPIADPRPEAFREESSRIAARTGSAVAGGLDIAPAEFDQHVEELHVEHSNALHARLRARGEYLVGRLARFALNFDELRPVAKEAAVGVEPLNTAKLVPEPSYLATSG